MLLAPPQPVPDCQTCGACCTAKWAVDVEGSDDVPPHLVKDDRLFGPIMRCRAGNCIALRGTVGGAVRCSIYERRPQVCRGFEPGSEPCKLARKVAQLT